jgi:uncharacterized protein YdhG (YjbR/CyaY superfamily)
MQSKARTVAEYIAELPDERRAAIETLTKLARKIAPEAEEVMEYGMPGYKIGHKILCGIASQKNHMSVYVCIPEVVDAYRDQLGKLNCGKGCIRFTKLEKVPLPVLEKILVKAVERLRT